MQASDPLASKYQDLDLFLRTVTQGALDPTYSLLKTHLLFEELLRDYLGKVLPNPGALKGARLTFAQLLAVAKATSPHASPDDWLWSAISELNKVRNQLAHNLDSAALANEIDRYTELVIRNMKMPLPPPAGNLKSADPPPGEPIYLAFDMANAALFSYATAMLRLIPPELLRNERTLVTFKSSTPGS